MSTQTVGTERRAEGRRRREFLKFSVAASGGLLLGFYFPGTALRVCAGTCRHLHAQRFCPDRNRRTGHRHREPLRDGAKAFIRRCPCCWPRSCDAGLDRRSALNQAPVDAKYNHPAFGMQMTGGSSSVWSGFEQFRQAGAAARSMLVAAAAQRWNIDPASCRTESGAVFDISNGDSSNRKLTYGQLAADAAKRPPPAKVELKDPKNFKLIRKPIKTPRHSRQTEWQSGLRTRREPAGNADGGGSAPSDLRGEGKER